MYVPKTKIIPNQYTDNQELAYKNTLDIYTGYYHILADGKVFTGKNPNDGVPIELIFLPRYNKPRGTQEPTYRISPTSIQTLYSFGTSKIYYDRVRLPQTKQFPLSTLIEPEYKKPIPKYPSFMRYYVKRANNKLFIEIDKEQYTKMTERDNRYNWPSYIPFELYWTTGGETRLKLKQINRNIVLFTEQRQKLTGLSQYITNYTEFAI